MPTLALNKQAKFNYDFLEKFEAGLVLAGHEVKAVKNGQMNLKGAYVTIDKNGEAHLLNAHISPYKKAGPMTDYDPERTRKLLLHKKEIENLQTKTHATGLTIIPVSVYTKGTKIKCEIALAKGKKKFDKRQDIKNKEEKRKSQRLLRRKI